MRVRVATSAAHQKHGRYVSKHLRKRTGVVCARERERERKEGRGGGWRERESARECEREGEKERIRQSERVRAGLRRKKREKHT
jgi:hypothetical protein